VLYKLRHYPAESLLNIHLIRRNSASSHTLLSFNIAVKSTATLLLPRRLYSSDYLFLQITLPVASDIVCSSPH